MLSIYCETTWSRFVMEHHDIDLLRNMISICYEAPCYRFVAKLYDIDLLCNTMISIFCETIWSRFVMKQQVTDLLQNDMISIFRKHFDLLPYITGLKSNRNLPFVTKFLFLDFSGWWRWLFSCNWMSGVELSTLAPLPVSPVPDNGDNDSWILIKWWLGGENRKYWERNLLQDHCVYHRSYMDSPGIELRPPRLEATVWPLQTWHGFYLSK